MPYLFIPAEPFVTYNDFVIYHTYQNDNINQPHPFYFSLDENNDTIFDVRSLPHYHQEDSLEVILMQAIHSGYFK